MTSVESGSRTKDAGGNQIVDMHRAGQLVALDAMFRLGSVSAAAKSLDMHVSAMSRLLSELRAHFDDKLFSRTGRGMVPTPFAEKMRERVRRVVADAETLYEAGSGDADPELDNETDRSWAGETAAPMPPLAVRQADPLDGAPSPELIARRISAIDANAPPTRRLAKYIAICGPGPGRSRALNEAEAEDAFAIILKGEADPVQIGALMMPLQYRGATATELAGFVKAARSLMEPRPSGQMKVDLDWPTYVSASSRRPPWFVQSARLVATAGFSVAMHGYFGDGADSGKIETAAQDMGIPVCRSLAKAAQTLSGSGIVYLPLGAMSPPLQGMLGLYHLFETRTPLHLIAPLLNPLDAASSLLGAAKLSQRDLFREVARVLGRRNLTVVGSLRDYAQLLPGKSTMLYRLVAGEMLNEQVRAGAPVERGSGPLAFSQREYWNGLWTGAVKDATAEMTVVGTAATGLQAIETGLTFREAMAWAQTLWQERPR